MKKIYSKPEIIFEDFTLSENIAGDCEGIVGNPAKGTCAYLSSGGIATFTDSVDACDFTPADMGSTDDRWDGFCYHVPIETNNLFNS